MITKHSIDLKRINDKCFAKSVRDSCRITSAVNDKCGTYRCPFYKPEGCKDWVRIEDNTGINLIPPEDFTRRKK